jgi:hypothetical protein
MMTKTKITREIERTLWQKFVADSMNVFGAFEVTVGYTGYKVACVRIPYGLSLTDSSRKVYYEDSITVRFDIPKVEPIANNPKTNISDEVIASMKRMGSPWHHW